MNTNSAIKGPKEIGILIKEARKKMGLTQAKAAALCGVGTRFLSELENGKKSTLHLGKVIQVLNNFGFILMISRKEL